MLQFTALYLISHGVLRDYGGVRQLQDEITEWRHSFTARHEELAVQEAINYLWELSGSVLPGISGHCTILLQSLGIDNGKIVDVEALLKSLYLSNSLDAKFLNGYYVFRREERDYWP